MRILDGSTIPKMTPKATLQASPTHSQYCEVAVRWLKLSIGKQGPGCNIAVSECTGSYSGEIADAFGMRSIGAEQHSVLVEVKMSLADFRADALKPHRSGGVVGMGTFRYYLAPQGLIPLVELPRGWGLIEVTPRGKPVVRCGHVLEKPCKELRFKRDWSGWIHEKDKDREIALIVRLLERVGDVDVLHKKLKFANNAKAKAEMQVDALLSQLKEKDAQYWTLKSEVDSLRGRGDVQPKARQRRFNGQV